MKQLALSLLLSLPFCLHTMYAEQPAEPTRHFNLAERNETVKNAIEFLDGHFGRIDGNTFGLILSVRSKIQNIQYGDRDPNNRNNRIGNYTFKGKRCSVCDLVEMERKFPGNAELEKLLIKVKEDFELLVGQFIEQAAGTKSFLLKLIEESCRRHNRNNSLLLTWASAPEGHETIIFHTEVQSFEALNDFCQDLSDFLGDLMFSCPKAMNQFKKNREDFVKQNQK